MTSFYDFLKNLGIFHNFWGVYFLPHYFRSLLYFYFKIFLVKFPQLCYAYNLVITFVVVIFVVVGVAVVVVLKFQIIVEVVFPFDVFEAEKRPTI